MRKHPFFARAVMTLLVTVLTTSSAWATKYIQDVMLVGGTKGNVLAKLITYTRQGWSVIEKDLNDGCGEDTDYIHLIYKEDSYGDGFNYGSITGFYIYSRTDSTLPPDTQTVGGRTYHLVPCAGDADFVDGKGDLNEGCGGNSHYIYLYYTRDAFPDNRVVTSITFNNTESGALGTNGGTTPYDLNKGASGDYIYMHVTTANTYDPVIIGNGDSGAHYLPLNMNHPYSLVQQLYTAEEIKTAGTIKAIAFYFRYLVQSTFDKQHIRVYLKQTDNSSLSGTTTEPVSESNGYTLVYDGSFSASGEGWTYIRLDTPYEYDGDQNLIVCCYDYGSEAYTGNHTFSVHQAPGMAKAFSSDSSFEPGEEQQSMYTDSRNNIRLHIVPNPYHRPTGLSVTRTEYTANVSWSAPTGTNLTINGYEWQFKTAAAENWSSSTSTNGTTASLAGLSACTEYLFRVRVKYAGNHYSNFAILRFSTAIELPYDCGFENGMPGWSEVDPNHYYNDYLTGIKAEARHDGEYGYMFRCYDSNPIPQYLISPELPGDKQIMGSFYYRNFANTSPETFQVGYSTSTKDVSAFTWGNEITPTGTEWWQYQQVFPVGTQYIAVKYKSNLYWLFLDDFEFSVYSPYEKPSGFSVTEMTDQRFSLKWNAPDGATGYVYIFRPVDGGNWSSEETITGTSVTLENLTANTLYDLRIKALFNGNESNYVNVRFMTEGPMESLPHYQDFENGMGGWRLVDGNGRTGITTLEQHDGSYGFEFDEGSPQPQILRSPMLDGNSSKIFSFYFKNYTGQAGESTSVGYRSAFQVGWSTDTNPLGQYSTASEVEAVNGRWTRYSCQLPEGVHYVLIRVPDQTAWLYVDDISITDVPLPEAVAAMVMGEMKYVTTFYSGSKSWQLPNGALAYTVTRQDDDLVFYRLGDESNIIPKGRAVVIVADKMANDTENTKVINLTITDAAAPPLIYENILQGSDTPVAVSGGEIGGKTVYVLGIINGKLDFYPFIGSEIPAGKAYYLGE